MRRVLNGPYPLCWTRASLTGYSQSTFFFYNQYPMGFNALSETGVNYLVASPGNTRLRYWLDELYNLEVDC